MRNWKFNAKLSERPIKSNFIATISHELKTPLTSIIGYAEMLGRLSRPDSQRTETAVEHYLERHLLELIEQLLDLTSLMWDSRFEPAEITSKPGWIGPCLMCVHRRTKSLFLFKDAVPVWHGDFHRLRRVLTNLLNNAVKFTPEGGHVTVRTVWKRKQATISLQ